MGNQASSTPEPDIEAPLGQEELLANLSSKIEGRFTRQARMYAGSILRAYAEDRFDYDKVMQVFEEVRNFNSLLLKKNKLETPDSILEQEIEALEMKIRLHFPTVTQLQEEIALNRESVFAFVEEATMRGIISQEISNLIRNRFEEIMPSINRRSVSDFLEIVSTRANLVLDPRQSIEGEDDELMTFELDQMGNYSLKQLVCLYLKTRLRAPQDGAENMYDPRIKNWTPEAEKKLQHLLFPKE